MSIPTITEMENADDSQGYEVYAKIIMRDFSFKTLRDTEEILIYEDGIYKKRGDSFIKEKCQELIGKCTTSKCKEVINVIKRSTYVSREEFYSNPNYLNLQNGILNIKTGKLQRHSPDHLFRVQLPVSYDQKIGPVKFMKFLMETLPDVRNRTNAIEAFAYTLLLDLKLEKMIMNLGGGSNGKSTFLSIIEMFLGIENVSHTSIHELLLGQFTKSRLDGKLANIYADISRKEITELGAVKAIISGDTIDVEKKYQESFPLRNTAKLIYSCNELPEIGESSHAVYRRMLLIEWNQQFTHQDGNNRINPNLLKELTTAKEFSGILNLLIKVARRLIRNGKFTYDSQTSELQKIWDVKSNPIGKFLDVCVEQDHETKTPKAKLFEEFTIWCRENQITPKSEKVFNAKVSESFGIQPTTGRIDKKPTKIWHGLKILRNVTAVTNVTTLTS